MTCISCLIFRISLFFKFVISLPTKKIAPSVGSCNLKIVRPSVDFPDPDSPTNEKVSPLRICSEISSTALTNFFFRLNMPSLIGKYFFKFFVSTRMSGSLTTFSEGSELLTISTFSPPFKSFKQCRIMILLFLCLSPCHNSNKRPFVHLHFVMKARLVDIDLLQTDRKSTR